MKYFGYFPQYVNWSNHSYLGPDARTGFSYYHNLYSSLNSARNYDLRENPHLFNEAVGLLQRYSAPGGLNLSGYPSVITSSIPELYKVRDMMYSHFVKERDKGYYRINQTKTRNMQEGNLTANYDEASMLNYWGISSYTSVPDDLQRECHNLRPQQVL